MPIAGWSDPGVSEAMDGYRQVGNWRKNFCRPTHLVMFREVLSVRAVR